MKRKKVHRLLLIIDIVLMCVLLTASFFLVRTLLGYRSDRKRYDALSAMSVTTPAPTSALPQLSADWSPPTETPPITVDFTVLKEQSRHVEAWLYSENTPINYPVVRYTNNEYYLTHAYDGSRSNGGALFFDCRLDATLSADNLIIYGHHMKNDTMFGSLLNYQSNPTTMRTAPCTSSRPRRATA